LARISGIDLPKDKHVEIALTYIYGIGRSSSADILQEAGVTADVKVKDLSDEQVSRIRSVIDQRFKVEGDLRKEVAFNIKRLMDIGSYRGLRHRRSMPVRGQRTHTNARTRRGRRKTTIGRKK
jgi:small subunit ribosomal protein S13